MPAQSPGRSTPIPSTSPSPRTGASRAREAPPHPTQGPADRPPLPTSTKETAMSTTTDTQQWPERLSPEQRDLRRKRVDRLAERVRRHLDAGTLKSDPQADVDLAQLTWETGGMSLHIERTLIAVRGEEIGTETHRALFARELT